MPPAQTPMEPYDDATFAMTMPDGLPPALRLARASGYSGGRPRSGSRFVQQSHALSTPIARPRSLFIAATIALALYILGRRLSR